MICGEELRTAVAGSDGGTPADNWKLPVVAALINGSELVVADWKLLRGQVAAMRIIITTTEKAKGVLFLALNLTYACSRNAEPYLPIHLFEAVESFAAQFKTLGKNHLEVLEQNQMYEVWRHAVYLVGGCSVTQALRNMTMSRVPRICDLFVHM